MKKPFTVILLLVALALAACGGQTTPEPTEAPPTEAPEVVDAPTEAPPTAEPAEEPTPEAPESPLESIELLVDPDLVNLTWEWVERNPNGSDVPAVSVPNPENYTLLFNEDGTFSAQVDCNRAAGSYATDGSGVLVMGPGPMTLAACEPESLGDAMAMMFAAVQSYSIEEDGTVLRLNWADGGPIDTYRVATVGEPGAAEIQGIPQDAIQMDLQGLAQTFQWEVRPAQPLNQGPGARGFPPHILLTFDEQTADEALADPVASPHLFIFPRQAYIDLYSAAGNSVVADQVMRLEQLIAEANGRTTLPADPMPLLPPPNSLMDRWAQFSDLDFGAGTGVRYVSDSPLRQAIGVWANDTTGYYYQGLSSDGVFYISLYWPVTTESLPNTAADASDEAKAQAENGDTYPTYIQTTRDALNRLGPEAWTPNLDSLDALVNSITFPLPAPSLTSTTWQWVSTTTPVEVITVSDPARYTIVFNEDGTASIRADCNNVLAEYTAEEGALTITLGPSTLVACPPESLDQQYLTGLSSAALYFFETGDLYIDMMTDAGTMRFQATEEVELPDPEIGEATGTVTAPDGVFIRTGPGTEYPHIGAAPFGETGEIVGVNDAATWWAVNVPVTAETPDGIGWVAAEFVDATNTENVPVLEAPAPVPPLVGITWEWVSLTTPTGVTAVSNPENYTILFSADDTAAIRADCNNVGAGYTADGSSLSIQLGPTTLAACPPDSLDQLFTSSLSSAALYFFEAGDLFIDLAADAGTMRFRAATSAAQPPSTDTPSGGAEGIEFTLVSFGPVGAPQPVLPGTTLTATFSDTQMAGFAGCNNYTATLTPVNDYFTIGPVATTRKACVEPEGIMEQEQTFLAALEAVNGYLWQQEVVNNINVITAGELFYLLPDGTQGVMNFIAGQ